MQTTSALDHVIDCPGCFVPMLLSQLQPPKVKPAFEKPELLAAVLFPWVIAVLYSSEPGVVPVPPLMSYLKVM